MVDQHAALGLDGRHEGDADEVGGESRPRRVGDGQDGGLARVGVDAVGFLSVDDEVVALPLELHPHLAESVGNQSQMVAGAILNGQLRLGHGRHTDEAAHLDHVGEDAVRASVQLLDPLNLQQIGADAGNLRTHVVEHGAKLVQIGFAGGVEDGGFAFR